MEPLGYGTGLRGRPEGGTRSFNQLFVQGELTKKQLVATIAIAVLLSFGTAATLTYAGDPAPTPTDDKGKPKPEPSGPKVSADDEKDKKDDKGGK